MTDDEYDGFYFLPGEEDGDINLAYFRFKQSEEYGEPVEYSSLGDKYHVAFFRKDVNGDPVFDEEFEAIFADPAVYIKNLIGSGIYGCFLRKTENSSEWWREYLTKAQQACMINKMKNVCQSILESRS
jgi:hypothetical protein